MNLKIGDSVKVKKGVTDADNKKILIENWQGRVTEINDNFKSISIAWDSFTLKQMPDEFIIDCENEGLDWTSYNLGVSDVILTKKRDTINEVSSTINKIDDKFAYAHLGTEGKRIMQILNGISSNDTFGALKRWNNYLENKIILPEEMEIYEFQENYKFSPGDKIYVEKLQTTDEFYGVLISGKLKGQKVQFPLADLEVSNKKSVNYQIIKDYCIWFANKR